MWWNIPRWITLFCNEGSIRLRPECPWRARKKRIIPETSVQYWYLHFAPPPPAAKHASHRLSDQQRVWANWLRICCFILQKWNRSILFSLFLLTKKMDYFLRNFVRRERVTLWFNINPIPCVHRNDARWFINKFTSLWFCFFLWSACTILPIQLYRLFFRLIFRNFCVVPLRIHRKIIWSMRNSNPRVSVVFTQRQNSNHDSVLTM